MIARNSDGGIDIDLLEIQDVIDINLLQVFQDNFAESMGIASVTVDINGEPITKPSNYTSFCIDFVHSTAIGDKRCAESHRKGGEKAAKIGRPYLYSCHAGLIDFAAPILASGKQIGTILGGQVLTEKPEEIKYRETAKEIGVEEDKFIESINKIKISPEKNVKAAAEVLFIVANSLSRIGYEELRLKDLSEQLTIEVQNKDLLLEESEKYNRLKTLLFSTISHELKTPINIIFCSVQLMESLYNANMSARSMELFLKYFKTIKQNCYRLIRLINNLIDMNKIELGFFDMDLKNNNIVSIVEDITLSVVEFAKQKGINLIFDTEVEEKLIACDSEKLERIMLNLLSNAIKYTNPGGDIFVNIYDMEENISVSVRDTGCGIPENMISKIFGAFMQVDSSFKRKAEGSGIGLYLVKFLVEMHGWNITVKSQFGEGTEFIIKVPVKVLENEVSTYDYKENDFNDYVEKINIEFSDIYL